ncbi:hypothetical protein BX600DRAFT_498931 [Xylariales sp. PMI_506]|nr:hypothetical protein BX600DRAFT_498931 [Xylariales sp. PMI_506]
MRLLLLREALCLLAVASQGVANKCGQSPLILSSTVGSTSLATSALPSDHSSTSSASYSAPSVDTASSASETVTTGSTSVSVSQSLTSGGISSVSAPSGPSSSFSTPSSDSSSASPDTLLSITSANTATTPDSTSPTTSSGVTSSGDTSSDIASTITSSDGATSSDLDSLTTASSGASSFTATSTDSSSTVATSAAPSTANDASPSASSSSSISISLPADFTLTYTYTEFTLPTYSTPPLSSQGPAETDVPPVPEPSLTCILDVNDLTDTFSISSPSFIPVIPSNGKVALLQASDLPADVATNGYTAPTYYFRTSTIPDQYDLLVSTGDGSLLYVAADTSSGDVVTSSSSHASGVILTSIFSVSCQGQLQVTIDAARYIWKVGDDQVNTILVAGIQDTNNTMVVIPSAPPPTATSGDPASPDARRRKRINYEGGQCPRCPNSPPELVATPAPGARGPEFNGCGTGATSSLIPQLVFGGCCNNHDLCFDDCLGGYFETCNSDFSNCMENACASNYPWLAHPWDRAVCETAAKLYAWTVSTFLGKMAFYEANYFDSSVANNPSRGKEQTGRCECFCGSPNHFCNGACVSSYLNDVNNCGSCGMHCEPNAICQNGNCFCPYDILTDINHCGSCAVACAPWLKCKNGMCSCPADQCGNLCVDFQNHPRNCGSCGNVCASGYCYQGQCVTPPQGVCNPGNVITDGDFVNGTAAWTVEPSTWDGSIGQGINYPATDIFPQFTHWTSLATVTMNYPTSTLALIQNITICPGHLYELTFSIGYTSLCPSLSWAAYAAGQTIGSGSLSNLAIFEDTLGIGPLYMNPIPAGPKGSGFPGSADYTTYHYSSDGVNIYTQLALVVSMGPGAYANLATVSFEYHDIAFFQAG